MKSGATVKYAVYLFTISYDSVDSLTSVNNAKLLFTVKDDTKAFHVLLRKVAVTSCDICDANAC